MKENKREVVLVTGGAGFIGTHLCRTLISEGHKVVSLDLKGIVPISVPGVHYYLGDARDLTQIKSLIHEHEVTAVYHLAATVSIPLCQEDALQSYSNNVMATLNVLEACRLSGRPIRFAFSSSAALYGNLGNNREPLSEHRVADRFSSFYAAQKHASEKMIEIYSHLYQIPSLIFRFFNVYGEGQDPKSPYSGVITIFSNLAREKKSLTLNDSGVQTRDFISAIEVAQAISSALKLPTQQWDACVINLGSGIPTSVRELAELIRNITGSESPIVDAPPRVGDVQHSLANNRRARELLGFQPTANLSRKLQDMLMH